MICYIGAGQFYSKSCCWVFVVNLKPPTGTRSSRHRPRGEWCMGRDVSFSIGGGIWGGGCDPSQRFLLITPPPVGGRGIVFERFLSLFVSLSATLRENGWTDLHEIFREGVEWPWDDVIKFWVNSGKRVGGSKVNLLSPAIAIWFVVFWQSGAAT